MQKSKVKVKIQKFLKTKIKISGKINKQKLIAIVGPTATGKTELAIELAKKFKGEIICVDSRTVYCGLDIGTAKPTWNEKFILRQTKFGPVFIIKNIPHYMLDAVSPSEIFTVADFQKLARKIMTDIWRRGKIPFLVGGTGLYLNALIYGYKIPPADLKLRARLEKFSTEKNYKDLKKIDKISAEKIGLSNRRKLIRALEVFTLTGRPISDYKKEKPSFDYLILGLEFTRQELYRRIDERVVSRIKAGMIDEVSNLLKSGISSERLKSFGLEYRILTEFLEGPETANRKNEFIQKLKFAIHAFARRQSTWFRKIKKMRWIRNQTQAERLIRNFLSNN